MLASKPQFQLWSPAAAADRTHTRQKKKTISTTKENQYVSVSHLKVSQLSTRQKVGCGVVVVPLLSAPQQLPAQARPTQCEQSITTSSKPVSKRERERERYTKKAKISTGKPTSSLSSSSSSSSYNQPKDTHNPLQWGGGCGGGRRHNGEEREQCHPPQQPLSKGSYSANPNDGDVAAREPRSSTTSRTRSPPKSWSSPTTR